MKTGYSWKAPASDVSIPCGLTRTLPPSGAPGLPMLENRTYVEVMAAFTPEGRMRPAAICWEDGRVFEIERICGHCHRRTGSIRAGRRDRPAGLTFAPFYRSFTPSYYSFCVLLSAACYNFSHEHAYTDRDL